MALESVDDNVRSERVSARKSKLIDGMIDGNPSDARREEITRALKRFPIEMIDLVAEAGTRIRPLGNNEKYRDFSPALRRVGVDVDAWPVPPAGLFVVEERTLYLRQTSMMTVGHEFGHAVDAALGGGVYRSGIDSEFRQAFATEQAFVTPYAASGLDEAFAESLRAYIGGLNDSQSLWPRATPERLKSVSPRMSAFFDGVMTELRERSQERERERDVEPAIAGGRTEPPLAEGESRDDRGAGQVPAGSRDRSDRRDYRQEITDKMIAAIEAGTAPWQKGWDAGERLLPYNPTTEKSYRGGNTLRLMLEGRDDPRWMTYKQAKEQGWQVRKGERGTTIEYWKFDSKERDAKETANEDREPAGVGEEEDRERPLRPRVFYATVFNATQIEGIPTLERPELRWNASERAEQLIAALGVDVQYGGNRAYYAPEAAPNVIHLPPREAFHDSTAFYDTLFHEAAHWTGHRDRLDRDLSGRFGSESYAKEELRAEIAGAFMAAEIGIPRDPDNNAAYVASWVSVLRNDKNEIFRAASAAQQIADFVFERALERVQDLADLEPSSPSAGGDISKLVIFEPAAWEIVDRREDSIAAMQTMTILGRSADSLRVFGRDGGAVLSVAAESIGASSLQVGETVRLSRSNVSEIVERVDEPDVLEVGR